MRGWEVIPICMVGLFVSAAAGLAADAPQTPSQAPLPLPPVGHLVSLSVAPHEYSGSTSMHPGTHLMDEPLRLQVTSHYPGWYMHIQATSLKGPDDEIGPEDIHIVTKQAEVALDQPQPVVQSGDGGETILEVLFELRTTKYHKPGAYRGQLLVMAGYPQGLPPPGRQDSH